MGCSLRSDTTSTLTTSGPDADDMFEVSPRSPNPTASTPASSTPTTPAPNDTPVASTDLPGAAYKEKLSFYDMIREILAQRNQTGQPISLETKTTRNESALRSTLAATPTITLPSFAEGFAQIPGCYSTFDLISTLRFGEVRDDLPLPSASDILALRDVETMFISPALG